VQSQRPALIQAQQQKLSPQMLQSLQILALPLLDLEQRITEELEANPALEAIQERQDESLDTTIDHDHDGDPFPDGPSAWESYEYGTFDGDDEERKHDFMQSVLTRPESLQEHLLWQLRLQPLPDEYFQIGELLIRNLDKHGFHFEDPKMLVSEAQWPTVEKVIAIIQLFEPIGTCVANFKESLLVQARQYAEVPPAVEPIITSYIEQLEKGNHKEVLKALKINEDEYEDAIAFIKQLEPFPGLKFSGDASQYVIPDVLVRKEEDEFVIIINDERIPLLGINPFFDAMLKKDKEKSERDTRRFVQGKLRDARWFINSIRMRNETLAKVARTIVAFQKEFFLHGPRNIVPLTLRDIADEIGVHEATVSRMTSNKYMQTDWGLFEMKYFFSVAISGTAGQQFSRESVKFLVKEVLDEHGGAQLSDQKIAELLEKKGVKIARRTVAKYRKELDIASSYDR